MNIVDLKVAFEKEFDLVGIIKSKRYLDEARKLNLNVPTPPFQTMVVLGLAYPKRTLSHTKTHLVPSFYTFGQDYHTVLKDKIKKVMHALPMAYEFGVDNHPHNERLAAISAKIGFFGKNQLIINETYGSYFFLGIVFVDIEYQEEIILSIEDDCGPCRKCIDLCPTGALFEGGYDFQLCMSHFNQAKKVLSFDEMKSNYSLFGCDICQLVCPKNIQKGIKMHKEFELSGKEFVSISDLFTLSEKAFREKYNNMAYLWKGKTILMRNAMVLLDKFNHHDFDDLIKNSIDPMKPKWYTQTYDKINHSKNQ